MLDAIDTQSSLSTPTGGARAPWTALRWAALVIATGWLGGGCVSPKHHSTPDNAIRIGTTLPFSGARAASGGALERAMQLAVDTVNQAGGLLGRPLVLEVRDSQSDDVLGTQTTLDLLAPGNLPFFIGPEEPRIAYQIEAAIKTHRMVNLLPGLTSPQIHDPTAYAAWFRLSPSANYLACALAKRMYSDQIRKANAVTDPDDYSGTFATIFGRVFTNMGGTLLPGLQLPASGSSFDDVFATIERFSPDATLLITSPTVGAGFLQEWAVRGKVGKFYLGPTLNNPALLRNVPAGVLEDLLGISPGLGDQAQTFDQYFEAATGSPPEAGAHYYFDAIALLALAMADGVAQTGVIPDAVTFARHLQNVTTATEVDGGSTTANIISYAELARGLSALAAGQKIEYHGAAGEYVLSSDGDSIKNQGDIWQIKNNSFQTIGAEQCTDAEVYPGY